MKKLGNALTITANIDKGIWGSVNRLIGIALLLACGTVGAQTVNISSCTVQPSVDCVTGIDGLDVLGVSYNMTVLNGTFTDLFSDPASQLTSWGDLEWGQSARQAIVNALNGLVPIPTQPTTKFVEDGQDDRHDSILHLPEEYQEFNSDPMGAFNGPCVQIRVGASVLATNCGTWLSHDRLAFATFTAATIGTPVILDVRDVDTPGDDSVLHVGGLTENVSGFVDRDDNQNWIDVPPSLEGADYIESAQNNADVSDDRPPGMDTLLIEVDVAEGAVLYMFIHDDQPITPFPWMNFADFGADWVDTGLDISWTRNDGTAFDVWRTLGPLAAGTYNFRQMPVDSSFYGIAALGVVVDSEVPAGECADPGGCDLGGQMLELPPGVDTDGVTITRISTTEPDPGDDGMSTTVLADGRLFVPPFMRSSSPIQILEMDSNLVIENGTILVTIEPGDFLDDPLPCDSPIPVGVDPQLQDIVVWQTTGASEIAEGRALEITSDCGGSSRGRSRGLSFFVVGLHLDCGVDWFVDPHASRKVKQCFADLTHTKFHGLIDAVKRSKDVLSRRNYRKLLGLAFWGNVALHWRFYGAAESTMTRLIKKLEKIEFEPSDFNHSGNIEMRAYNVRFMITKIQNIIVNANSLIDDDFHSHSDSD